MTSGPDGIDYMSADGFKRRANKQIENGWKTMGEDKSIVVAYDSDFNKFAANVAFQLRHYMTYRSDGGFFARGLVRASTDLQKIHKDGLLSTLPNGTPVRLATRLYRRQHLVPTERVMMSIQFRYRPMKLEGEDLTASQEVTAKSKEKFAEKVLDQAALIVQGPTFIGDRAKRLRDWIKIAEQVQYPNFLHLWYYARPAVREYVNFDTWDARRAIMTAATGGKMPFDGDTGTGGPGGGFRADPNTPWKIYPFRRAVEQCRGQHDTDNCNGIISRELIRAEDEIFRTISEMDKETKGRGSAQSDLVGAFLMHMKDLMKAKYSLYSPMLKYTQAKPSLWEKF